MKFRRACPSGYCVRPDFMTSRLAQVHQQRTRCDVSFPVHLSFSNHINIKLGLPFRSIYFYFFQHPSLKMSFIVLLLLCLILIKLCLCRPQVNHQGYAAGGRHIVYFTIFHEEIIKFLSIFYAHRSSN